MVFLESLYYVLLISSRGLLITMMMMMNLVFAGPSGLSLKLIHRDSPESPLYPGNLTQLERMERAFQQSIHREQQLTAWMKSSLLSKNTSGTNSKSLDTVRPPVSLGASGLYMVQIGIGAFPNHGPQPAPGQQDPIFYYFLIDTGSNLLWLQCKGNNTVSFLQDDPPFDSQTSFTYRALPANSPNPICGIYGNVKEGGFCGYSVTYSDGSSTAGILAKEKLTLNADYGLEVIDNFVFGCGLRQINYPALGKNDPGKNPIAGILGLGRGKESFTRQLGNRAQNKFEYCLKPWYDRNPFNTFLRFGSDTKIVVGGQGVQTTSIIPTRGKAIYYVIMEGISVAGERVFYPDTSVFASRPDGTGGSIFDSGCPFTQLSTQVYVPLKKHLLSFFYRNYKIQPVSPLSRFELCFERPNQFSAYPTITFHYTGADFVIEPKAAFYETDTVFCLDIRRTNLINSYSVILGSFQQVNHRILHDLEKKKISWVSETCAKLR